MATEQPTTEKLSFKPDDRARDSLLSGRNPEVIYRGIRPMNPIVRVASLALLVLVAGCSDPRDAVIPADTATWEKELAPELKKLSEDERRKFAAYVVRLKMSEAFGGADIAMGTTIGEAIAAQDAWEAEQIAKRAEEAALKAKIEQERAEALEQLNKAVTVTLISKQQLPSDYRSRRYSEYQEFVIGVRNDSEKVIIGVAGEIVFVDVFDKDVGAVSFRISEEIEPGESVTWTGGRDYNQFLDAHRAVWNLEEGKFTTKFIPDTVVFKDNTKLTANQ